MCARRRALAVELADLEAGRLGPLRLFNFSAQRVSYQHASQVTFVYTRKASAGVTASSLRAVLHVVSTRNPGGAAVGASCPLGRCTTHQIVHWHVLLSRS